MTVNGKSKNTIKKKNRKQKTPVGVSVALIGLFGTLVLATATYFAATIPVRISVSTTQTAEGKSTLAKITELANYTKTPISSPTLPVTPIPTNLNTNFVDQKIKITFPELKAGQKVGGVISFAPDIDPPAELKQLDIYINNEVLTSINSPPYVYAFDSTKFAPGIYDFTFLATDILSNYGYAKISLSIVDPIIIRVISPKAGETLSGNVKLAAEVSSLYGTARVDFSVDGNFIISDATAPYETKWDVSNLPAGKHIILVTAFDTNGFVDQESVVADIPVGTGSWILFPLIILIIILFTAIYSVIKIWTMMGGARMRKLSRM